MDHLPLPLNGRFPDFGGGDFGLKDSIRSVQPVVKFPLEKKLVYVSALKLSLVSCGPIVSQPGRMVESRPNKWRRRCPRQKCSMM